MRFVSLLALAVLALAALVLPAQATGIGFSFRARIVTPFVPVVQPVVVQQVYAAPVVQHVQAVQVQHVQHVQAVHQAAFVQAFAVAPVYQPFAAVSFGHAYGAQRFSVFGAGGFRSAGVVRQRVVIRR